jgi:predicted dehydrogenase
MNHRLRLGVIGAGSWAVTSHLPILAARHDDVEFVAVSGIGDTQLRQVKERFGFAIASEDYRDVVDADIDICVVSSPAAYHYEHAKAALEAGASVLIEKPVAIRPGDAWDLVATADRLDRHLLCAFGWNYRPLLRATKASLSTHEIGEIEHVSIRMASFTRELLSNRGAYPRVAPHAVPDSTTWTDPELSGGGYAQAELSHALGVSLWLTGLRGEKVFALTSSALDEPVELHDAIAVRYDNGAIGTIAGASAHANINAPENELDLHVVASEGQLSIDIARGRCWIGRPDDDWTLDLGPAGGIYDCDGPPNALVDLALNRPIPNCSPGELGARTVEILYAVYRSARSSTAVSTLGATIED